MTFNLCFKTNFTRSPHPSMTGVLDYDPVNVRVNSYHSDTTNNTYMEGSGLAQICQNGGGGRIVAFTVLSVNHWILAFAGLYDPTKSPPTISGSCCRFDLNSHTGEELADSHRGDSSDWVATADPGGK